MLIDLPAENLLEIVRFCDAKDCQRLLAVNREFGLIAWRSSVAIFKQTFKTTTTFNLPRSEILVAIHRASQTKSLKYAREVFCFAAALGLHVFVKERMADHNLNFATLPESSLLNGCASDGSPAIVLAATNRQARLVGLLAESGADLDKPDRLGRTAMIWAAKNSDAITMGLLLKHEAEVTEKVLHAAISATPSAPLKAKCVELLTSTLAVRTTKLKTRIMLDPFADSERAELKSVS